MFGLHEFGLFVRCLIIFDQFIAGFVPLAVAIPFFVFIYALFVVFEAVLFVVFKTVIFFVVIAVIFVAFISVIFAVFIAVIFVVFSAIPPALFLEKQILSFCSLAWLVYTVFLCYFILSQEKLLYPQLQDFFEPQPSNYCWSKWRLSEDCSSSIDSYDPIQFQLLCSTCLPSAHSASSAAQVAVRSLYWPW